MNRPHSRVDDPFFRLPDASEWNALIGQQGHEENYVDGYIQAAIELAEAVIKKGMYEKRDTLVMPILYNARHGLELSLKFSTARLNDMGVTSYREKHHHIMSYWRHLHEANLGDEALREYVAALKPYVDSLSQIDDDGQELRYSENRDGQKSLADKSLVNIGVIRTSLDAMSKVMSSMKYRVLALGDERRTGSFTSQCSRSDLFEIARMLPPKKEWQNPLFETAKSEVTKRFHLTSNKQFSKALDVIKSNREMGVIIGLERDLIHLTDAHAVFVVEQWSKRHPPREADSDLGTDITDLDWEMMQKHGRLSAEVNNAICEILTPDEIADVETIFYLGRDRVFCEQYEACLEATKKDHRVKGDPIEEVNHLMEKTNFLVCLAEGVSKLGRPNLARRLMEMRPDQAQT